MFGLKKKGLVLSCVVGLAAAVVLTGLFCLGLTPLFLRGAAPLERTDAAAPLAGGLAVFTAVLVVTKSRGRQIMPTAGIVAGGYILLAALACALGGRGYAFGSWLSRTAAASAAGALLGAVMSLRRTSVRRKRRHGR